MKSDAELAREWATRLEDAPSGNYKHWENLDKATLLRRLAAQSEALKELVETMYGGNHYGEFKDCDICEAFAKAKEALGNG